MIHYYYGDGKGKTSAAMGACLRAVGAGMKCAVVQFHKDGSSGEIAPLKELGVDAYACSCGVKFFKQMNDDEKKSLTLCHNENMRSVLVGEYDFIILDELGDALKNSTVELTLVEELLGRKACEFIVTGHKPVELLMQHADYITEFKCEEHPFLRGVSARRGIEY